MKVSPTPATPSTTSRRDITSSLLPTTSAPWVRTDTKFGDSERVTTDQPHAAGYAVAASGVSVTV